MPHLSVSAETEKSTTCHFDCNNPSLGQPLVYVQGIFTFKFQYNVCFCQDDYLITAQRAERKNNAEEWYLLFQKGVVSAS